MAGPCTCRHCATPAAVTEESEAHVPVELPDRPRPFRVHQPGRPPQDCVLHPDGTLTATFAGQQWRSALSFDEMRETSWAGGRIEWDPAPLTVEPDAEPEPAAVQDAIPLAA